MRQPRGRFAFHALRVLGVVMLASGALTAVSIVWDVATGDRPVWYLISLVPVALFSWWTGVGFFRLAADSERPRHVPMR